MLAVYCSRPIPSPENLTGFLFVAGGGGDYGFAVAAGPGVLNLLLGEAGYAAGEDEGGERVFESLPAGHFG